MIKFLYVSGDSFAFGQELNAPNSASFFDFTPYHSKHCYSGVMRDKLHLVGYKNDALPGGSNQRVYRKLLHSIPIILKTYSPDEIFVNISVTHAGRKEFFRSSHKIWHPYMPSYEPEKSDRPSSELWNILTREFHDDIGNYWHDFMMLFGIQNFLVLNKIRYLLTFSMDTLQTRKKNDNIERIIPQELLSQFKTENIYDDISFQHFVQRNGYKMGSGGHPLEEGHAAWADHLLEYIESKNLFTRPPC